MLSGLGHDPTLIRAGAVGLWAQTNYQQLTALFRVEERSVAYAIASVANVLITVVAMVLFVAVLHWGAVGLVVGNFVGTLSVYFALLAYRSEQLGLQFDRTVPPQDAALRDAARAVGARALGDQLRRPATSSSTTTASTEVGIYSTAIKVASVVTFVVIAFRTAWPAFAYSIEDDRAAKRTYAFVLTYLLTFASWLVPRARRACTLARRAADDSEIPARGEGRRAARLRASPLYAGYTVLAIGSGRATEDAAELGRDRRRRRSQRRAQLLADPPLRHGRRRDLHRRRLRRPLRSGWRSTRSSVYPVPYQWRRVVTAIGDRRGADRRGARGLISRSRRRSSSCSSTRSRSGRSASTTTPS